MIKLGKIVSICTGKLDSNAAIRDGLYPFYTCSPETMRINEYAFDQEAILLAGNNADGNYTAKYYNGKFNAYQRTYVINSTDTTRYDNHFIYYALNLALAELKCISQGTSTKFLTKTILNNLEIQDYPIEYQNKIVNIIAPIDNYVELLQSINDNLLEIGKQLFNDMLSTANLSPGKLSDIVDIIMGQSPPGESLSEKQNGMIFYQGRSEFGKIFPTPRLYTSDPKRIAPKGSVLVSVRAPVGDINLALNECCIGRGLAAIETKNSTPGFVHYLIDCLQPAFDIFNGNGTVFGSIDKISINNIEINIPDESSLKSFDEKAKTIDSLIETNHVEMMRLIELRDCLLPKLMSGVVDVSNLDLPTKYSFTRELPCIHDSKRGPEKQSDRQNR